MDTTVSTIPPALSSWCDSLASAPASEWSGDELSARLSNLEAVLGSLAHADAALPPAVAPVPATVPRFRQLSTAAASAARSSASLLASARTQAPVARAAAVKSQVAAFVSTLTDTADALAATRAAGACAALLDSARVALIAALAPPPPRQPRAAAAAADAAAEAASAAALAAAVSAILDACARLRVLARALGVLSPPSPAVAGTGAHGDTDAGARAGAASLSSAVRSLWLQASAAARIELPAAVCRWARVWGLRVHTVWEPFTSGGAAATAASAVAAAVAAAAGDFSPAAAAAVAAAGGVYERACTESDIATRPPPLPLLRSQAPAWVAEVTHLDTHLDAATAAAATLPAPPASGGLYHTALAAATASAAPAPATATASLPARPLLMRAAPGLSVCAGRGLSVTVSPRALGAAAAWLRALAQAVRDNDTACSDATARVPADPRADPVTGSVPPVAALVSLRASLAAALTATVTLPLSRAAATAHSGSGAGSGGGVGALPPSAVGAGMGARARAPTADALAAAHVSSADAAAAAAVALRWQQADESEATGGRSAAGAEEAKGDEEEEGEEEEEEEDEDVAAARTAWCLHAFDDLNGDLRGGARVPLSWSVTVTSCPDSGAVTVAVAADAAATAALALSLLPPALAAAAQGGLASGHDSLSKQARACLSRRWGGYQALPSRAAATAVAALLPAALASAALGDSTCHDDSGDVVAVAGVLARAAGSSGSSGSGDAGDGCSGGGGAGALAAAAVATGTRPPLAAATPGGVAWLRWLEDSGRAWDALLSTLMPPPPRSHSLQPGQQQQQQRGRGCMSSVRLAFAAVIAPALVPTPTAPHLLLPLLSVATPALRAAEAAAVAAAAALLGCNPAGSSARRLGGLGADTSSPGAGAWSPWRLWAARSEARTRALVAGALGPPARRTARVLRASARAAAAAAAAAAVAAAPTAAAAAAAAAAGRGEDEEEQDEDESVPMRSVRLLFPPEADAARALGHADSDDDDGDDGGGDGVGGAAGDDNAGGIGAGTSGRTPTEAWLRERWLSLLQTTTTSTTGAAARTAATHTVAADTAGADADAHAGAGLTAPWPCVALPPAPLSYLRLTSLPATAAADGGGGGGGGGSGGGEEDGDEALLALTPARVLDAAAAVPVATAGASSSVAAATAAAVFAALEQQQQQQQQGGGGGSALAAASSSCLTLTLSFGRGLVDGGAASRRGPDGLPLPLGFSLSTLAFTRALHCAALAPMRALGCLDLLTTLAALAHAGLAAALGPAALGPAALAGARAPAAAAAALAREPVLARDAVALLGSLLAGPVAAMWALATAAAAETAAATAAAAEGCLPARAPAAAAGAYADAHLASTHAISVAGALEAAVAAAAAAVAPSTAGAGAGAGAGARASGGLAGSGERRVMQEGALALLLSKSVIDAAAAAAGGRPLVTVESEPVPIAVLASPRHGAGAGAGASAGATAATAVPVPSVLVPWLTPAGALFPPSSSSISAGAGAGAGAGAAAAACVPAALVTAVAAALERARADPADARLDFSSVELVSPGTLLGQCAAQVRAAALEALKLQLRRQKVEVSARLDAVKGVAGIEVSMVSSAVNRAINTAFAYAEQAVLPWQRLRDPADPAAYRGLTVALALTAPIAERFTAWVLDAPDLSTAATERLFALGRTLIARAAAATVAAVAGADIAQTVTELQQVPEDQLPVGGVLAVLPARMRAPLAPAVAAAPAAHLLRAPVPTPADWAALAGLGGRGELVALQTHVQAVTEAQAQLRAANAASGGALSPAELALNMPPLGPPPGRPLPWARLAAVTLMLHPDLNLRAVRALAAAGVLWCLTITEIGELMSALFEESAQRRSCLEDVERLARGEV